MGNTFWTPWVIKKIDDMKMLGGGGEMRLDLGGLGSIEDFISSKYIARGSQIINKSIRSFRNKTNQEGLAHNLNCKGQQLLGCVWMLNGG